MSISQDEVKESKVNSFVQKCKKCVNAKQTIITHLKTRFNFEVLAWKTSPGHQKKNACKVWAS